MELGVYTFAELTSGIGPQERLRNLIEEIVLADAVGLVGRSSFIESFPLVGYDLADYDRLFEEKLRPARAPPRGARGVSAAGAGAVAGLGRGRRLA